MVAPKVCVLRAPGTNCDNETAHAFELCGGQAERMHLNRLLESPSRLDDFQILCVPGGFSFGDDIGSGVVFASQLRAHVSDALHRFLDADKLVLGICNGFQTLLKAGILPDGAKGWKNDSPNADSEDAVAATEATLTWNENGKYTARWVRLKTAGSKNVFLKGLEELDLPIAHAEGRIVTRSPSVVSGWRERGQIALEYVPWQSTEPGEPHPANERWAANPNGSTDNIAGLSDVSGRVLGLMPHPERFLFGTQHPHWTRLGLTGSGDGLKLFQNGIDYFT